MLHRPHRENESLPFLSTTLYAISASLFSKIPLTIFYEREDPCVSPSLAFGIV